MVADMLFNVGSLSICLLALLASWVSWLYSEDIKFKKRYRFPPQVPGLPLIGNSFQIPNVNQGPYLQKLAKQYGEMFTLKFGSTYWVVLNSRRVVSELLDKRAAIYSSRQNLPMAHSIMSGENRILLMPYGDAWRRQRKMMHQLLNATQQTIFKTHQDLESRALMFELLKQPETWYLSLGRFSNSVIMSVIYGQRTKMDDPKLAAIAKAQEAFVPYMMPGQSMVDSFPVLARIPILRGLQPWRRKGDQVYDFTLRVFGDLVRDLEDRMRRGVQKPCFMTEFLESEDKDKFTPAEIAFIAGTLIEAGTDTTRTSMMEVIAGTAMYPEWTVRAREELDTVCGNNAQRLPAFDDIEKLPMIRAAIKEAVRWRPTNAQTGIPHALTKDDEFEGYRFPAGTVFTWSNWAISHDLREFDRPEQFLPDRFLDDDVSRPQKGHVGFGAGRRLCVGYNVAASNMFIAMSRLIYCFDIEQDTRHPLHVDTPFPLDATVEPFKVVIRPRSEAHRQLIEAECKAAALV